MPLFNGHALIHQVGPSLTALVGLEADVGKLKGYGSVFIDDVALVYQSDREEIMGVNGQTGALVWTNERLEISMTFRPNSATSQILAESKSFIIRNGSGVELSGFTPVKMDLNDNPTGAAGDLKDILNTGAGDKWLVVGDSTLTLHAGAPAECQLVLRKYLKNQSTLLTRVTATGTTPASVPGT